MKSNILTIITMVLYQSIIAQNLVLSPITVFPNNIGESSGLICTPNNTLWTNNDGGNPSELFAYSTAGTYLRTLSINAPNTDWEDLAQDSQHNIYIGDFGNNGNSRHDLTIYKISPPDMLSGNATSPIGIIQFNLPDQTTFPPSDKWKNFDIEAFVAVGDSLYLFSKNRTIPYSSITKLYRLPQAPGNYTAQLVDSFDTTEPNSNFIFSITGADISPDGKSLVLCAAHKLWLFTNYSGHNFFKGNVQELNFDIFTQKEGVCFDNDGHTLYISDERNSTLGGGKIYRTDIANYLTTTGISVPLKEAAFYIITHDDQHEAIITLSQPAKVSLVSSNIKGQQKVLLKETTLNVGKHYVTWSIEETEFVSLYINNQLVQTEKVAY